MVTWTDMLVQQERYSDLLREAERERLIREALAGQERPARLHHRPLTWLGHRLAAWGQRLQERYGAMVEAPVLQASHKRWTDGQAAL